MYSSNQGEVIQMTSGINWIKCSEELPKKSGRYLAIHVPGHMQHIDYSAKHKKWNVCDDTRYFDYEIKDVQYWAEPNFPEGYEQIELEVGK
jgi:hypothetical protein